MTAPDSVLQKVRRPLFGTSLWAPLLVLLLGIAAIAFEGYQVVRTLGDAVAASTRAQGEATAREITGFIEREHERLSAFVDEKNQVIRDVVRSGGDDTYRVGLETSLRRMFPGTIAFTVTGADGVPVFEDFEGLVGASCQRAMRDYAQALVSGSQDIAIPPIHPVPGAYHFDVITPWTLCDGSSGLFFVSMAPQRIAELLAGAERASGHRLLLVNRDDPTLIEVTAEGGRDVLRGEFRIDAAALDRFHFARDLPGTHWRLLVLPDGGALAGSVREVLLLSGAMVFGLLVITGALLVLIRRQEQRNTSLFVRSLQSSVARQRAILQAMADALVTIDERGRIHHVNNAVTTLFGYEPGELIGRNVRVLMNEADSERHDSYMFKYMDTGESGIMGKGREVMARRKDGTLFPVLLNIGESVEGDERMFVGLMHDVSAYRHAQRKIDVQKAEIDRSHHELDRISEMASRSLASLGEPVEPGADSPPDVDAPRPPRDLSSETRDLRYLVQGLVDYTRAGRVDERAVVDLDEVLPEVLADLGDRVRIMGARVDVAPLGRVYGDRRQIHQLFWNLLDNALKFAHPQRAAEIRVGIAQDSTAGEAELVVVVRDNGVGITGDAVDKVFEAFYRVDPQHPQAGAGLGLAFCRRIVEAVGGYIELDSAVGEGTQVRVTLPRA
jgi:PAS domain S-box-containing protein